MGELLAQLDRGEVHVYVAGPDGPAPPDAPQGDHAPGLRRRSFGARVAATYLEVPPGAVRVDRGSGRPVLLDAPHLGFSLADSGMLLAVAIGAGAVGVDVEDGRIPRRVDRVVPRALSPRERVEVARGVGGTDRASFLRCWTRKEALAKALGCGLAIDLSAVDVGAATEPRDPPTIDDRATRMRLVDLPLDDPHVGAVAVDRTATVRWLSLP